MYQYVRHIFGAKCSPTCSNYALQRTAQDNKDSFPLEAEVVERNFYMDDLFKSVPSLLEAYSLQVGLVNLLSLSNWQSGYQITNIYLTQSLWKNEHSQCALLEKKALCLLRELWEWFGMSRKMFSSSRSSQRSWWIHSGKLSASQLQSLTQLVF